MIESTVKTINYKHFLTTRTRASRKATDNDKMGFGIIHLAEFFLLMANAMAILNERRVLSKFGLDFQTAQQNSGLGPKTQLALALHYARSILA